MRLIILILSICLLGNCGKPSSEKPSTTTTTTTPDKSKKNSSTPADCSFEGIYTLQNKKTFPQTNEIIALVTTEKEQHLVVKNRGDCTTVFNEKLPTTSDNSFAYHLASIQYNNTSACLVIKGYQHFLVYDIHKHQLSAPLQPVFPYPVEASDAQSGQIKHLELWEDYIIGYALDFGPFVYKIDNNHILPVAPYVYYQPPGTDQHHALFVLESIGQTAQILMPTYEASTQTFELNPFLKKPHPLDLDQSISSKDSKYVLFWLPKAKKTIGVDIQKRQKIALTKEQSSQTPAALMLAGYDL